jgi:hypothetical protein
MYTQRQSVLVGGDYARRLCAILASFVLITTLAQAQERNPQSSGSAALSTSSAGTTIVSLLQQSHDLGQQLPVSMRLNMLRRQVLMVSKLRSDLGREWANELFTLSFQAKEGHRAVAQETAMSVLIRLDPDRDSTPFGAFALRYFARQAYRRT